MDAILRIKFLYKAKLNCYDIALFFCPRLLISLNLNDVTQYNI